MGISVVKLIVKNIRDESRFIEENFLVDSGASFSVLPKELAEKVGIVADRKQDFVLADGRVISRKLGQAIFEFKSRRAASPVVIGKKNDSLLLGTLTLEAMGLVLDPFARKLYPAKLII